MLTPPEIAKSWDVQDEGPAPWHVDCICDHPDEAHPQACHVWYMPTDHSFAHQYLCSQAGFCNLSNPYLAANHPPGNCNYCRRTMGRQQLHVASAQLPTICSCDVAKASAATGHVVCGHQAM